MTDVRQELGKRGNYMAQYKLNEKESKLQDELATCTKKKHKNEGWRDGHRLRQFSVQP